MTYLDDFVSFMIRIHVNDLLSRYVRWTIFFQLGLEKVNTVINKCMPH